MERWESKTKYSTNVTINLEKKRWVISRQRNMRNKAIPAISPLFSCDPHPISLFRLNTSVKQIGDEKKLMDIITKINVKYGEWVNFVKG